MIDRDVVCVQPKVHTPMVGLGLRTLSHNLALLPPRGEASVAWYRLPGGMAPSTHTDGTTEPFKILLIPLPYEIHETWFESEKIVSSGPSEKSKNPWGWFNIRQEWLYCAAGSDIRTARKIVEFTLGLVREAKRKTGRINAIIFPEYALTWQIFRELCEAIEKAGNNYDLAESAKNLNDEHELSPHDVEFLVSGSSTNCLDHSGNFVLQAQFVKLPMRTDQPGQARGRLVTSRSKHHRWIIDPSQIAIYGLQNALDSSTRWSENILVHPREIHASVFRRGSIFASMICEDLARNDPCHHVLRDIGPNIVVVLLMDGPQLQTRWSARYAQSLSDDPGSAVLTFTSLGLIERINATGTVPRSRTVALFRGATGRVHEIVCPERSHGVVVSLRGRTVTETTLDGRDSGESYTWEFEQYQPVRVREPALIRDVIELE